MRKPIFVLSDYPSPYYPVRADCKALDYHQVFASVESAIEYLEGRFGYIIVKDKTKR